VQLRFRIELGGRGIQFRGVDVHSNGIEGRRLCGKRLVGGFADFVVDLRFQGFDLLLIENAFTNEKERKFRNRIAAGFFFAFLG